MVDNDTNNAEIDGRRSAYRDRSDSAFAVLLSGLLILGLPTLFWLSVLEFVNYVFSLGISSGTRLIMVGILIGMLALIWTSVLLAARERKEDRTVFAPRLASR